MKRVFAFISLSGFCIVCVHVYAGDGTNPVSGTNTNTTMRINRPYEVKNNAVPVKSIAHSNADVRSDFLFATITQPDLFKNMTFRSAVTGAGIMGAIMGGKIAAKIWLSPHVCFAPGANIGSKSADFTLTF